MALLVGPETLCTTCPSTKSRTAVSACGPPPMRKVMKLRSIVKGLLVNLPLAASRVTESFSGSGGTDVSPGAEACELTARSPFIAVSPTWSGTSALATGPLPKAVPSTSQPSWVGFSKSSKTTSERTDFPPDGSTASLTIMTSPFSEITELVRRTPGLISIVSMSTGFSSQPPICASICLVEIFSTR